MNFYTEARKNEWSYQISLEDNRVEVYSGKKTVAFDGDKIYLYTIEELVQKIKEKFDSIPNDPNMKKSKHYRWLEL